MPVGLNSLSRQQQIQLKKTEFSSPFFNMSFFQWEIKLISSTRIPADGFTSSPAQTSSQVIPSAKRQHSHRGVHLEAFFI